MKTYIAFLRGINVSGKKKIKMADLRTLLGESGLCDVQTYIQSGNIVFLGNEKAEWGAIIHRAIKVHYDFDLSVIVKTTPEIEDIFANNPFQDTEREATYYCMLSESPDQQDVENLRAMEFPNERFDVARTCVYLLPEKGYGNAKLNNNLIERKLNVGATTRNHRTMLKVLEMAKG